MGRGQYESIRKQGDVGQCNNNPLLTNRNAMGRGQYESIRKQGDAGQCNNNPLLTNSGVVSIQREGLESVIVLQGVSD